MGRPDRGPVGRAAEKLEQTLKARLSQSDSNPAVADGIFKALGLVAQFLKSFKESPEDFDQLKSQVRKAIIQQVKPKPCKASAAKALAPKDAASVDQQGPLVSSKSVEESSRMLYSRGSMQSQASHSSISSIDWTLAPQVLHARAFVKSGSYGKMAKLQDELAKQAEQKRQQDNAAKTAALKQMYDLQMEELERKRQAEVEAKIRRQREVDEEVRQYQKQEMDRLEQFRQQQDATRQLYKSQVDELEARRAQEEKELKRHQLLEKMQLEEAQRQEHARQLQKQREDAQYRNRVKAELDDAMRLKQSMLAQQLEEEKQYNIKYMKAMDAQQAAREKAVRDRQEQLARAFERGGGKALQANLKEQIRRDEERARRQAELYEAEVAEKLRLQRLQRQEMVQSQVATLRQQMHDKDLQSQKDKELKLKEMEQAAAWRAAEKARDKADKAARRAQQQHLCKQLKGAWADEARRKYEEQRSNIPEQEKWVHTRTVSGMERGYTNLAVPVGLSLLSPNQRAVTR